MATAASAKRQKTIQRRPKAAPPSGPTDAELVAAARAGDRRARDLLVERHLGLVKSLARRYQGLGLPFEDLVQEGSLGLLDAVDRFDPSRGAGFATFAFWRIRKTITQALTRQGRAVRLPARVVERQRLVLKTANRLAAENGLQPSVEELAEAAGLKPGAVEQTLKLPSSPASLDTAGPEGLGLVEALEDPQAPDPAQLAVEHEERAALELALSHLPEEERRIILHHFGLNGPEESLRQIGEELNLPPWRVRRLEEKALAELEEELEPDPQRMARKRRKTRARASRVAGAIGGLLGLFFPALPL